MNNFVEVLDIRYKVIHKEQGFNDDSMEYI